MKCSKCKESSIGWTGSLLKTENGWIALVSVVCSNCKRTYQAGIDWNKFELLQAGGFVEGKPPSEVEDLMPAGGVYKIVNSLAEQMEMPGTQDPIGR